MGVLTLPVSLRKVRRNIQDHGLLITIRKATSFLLRPFYEHATYRLYKIDLKHTRTSSCDINGIEFRLLDASDREVIRQIENTSEWLDGSVERRLKDGAVCIAAIDHEKLAGFNLISFGDVYMPLIRRHHRFRPREAWSEQIAVSKDFRKKGLGVSLRLRIFSELHRRGYQSLYGGALADNIPSLKLAERVGFREFVDVDYTRILTSRNWHYKRIHK